MAAEAANEKQGVQAKAQVGSQPNWSFPHHHQGEAGSLRCVQKRGEVKWASPQCTLSAGRLRCPLQLE